MSRGKVIKRVAKTLRERRNKGEDRIRKKDVQEVVNTTFDEMIEMLLEGELLNIYGLGKLKIVTRRAFLARNPKTGERVPVPEKLQFKMRASAGLKRRMEKVEITDAFREGVKNFKRSDLKEIKTKESEKSKEMWKKVLKEEAEPDEDHNENDLKEPENKQTPPPLPALE